MFENSVLRKVPGLKRYTYMAFHFINRNKPLGFGYETCLKNLTNITDLHKTGIYAYI